MSPPIACKNAQLERQRKDDRGILQGGLRRLLRDLCQRVDAQLGDQGGLWSTIS